MSKFNKLYEEIFKPADSKEKERRNKEQSDIQRKEFMKWVNKELKKGKLKQNSDGSYDYDDDIDIVHKNLKEIPIKFNRVSGYFNCAYNALTTLKNAPKFVGRGFYCDHNKLTSLKGCPKIINGDFSCVKNKLTTLKYSPEIVNGSCNYEGNKLISLEGMPKKITKGLWLNSNKLTSLVGCPKIIHGVFMVSNNNLTSLKGCPEKVDKFFHCTNQLTHKFTVDDVRAVCDVKGDIYV